MDGQAVQGGSATDGQPHQMQDQVQPSDEPTQTGSTDPLVDINDQQAAEIRTAIKEIDIKPAEVNFQRQICRRG